MIEQGRSILNSEESLVTMQERELINIVFSQNPKDKISSTITPVLSEGNKVAWVLTMMVRDNAYTLCSARSTSPRLFKTPETCFNYIAKNFDRTNNVEIKLDRQHLLALLGTENISVPISLTNQGQELFKPVGNEALSHACA